MARPARPQASLKHIAQLAGVSISTVSMALADHPEINSDTKRRIRVLSRQIGYRKSRRRPNGLARALDARTALRFGFILLGSPLQDPFHASTLEGLSDAASRDRNRIEVCAIEDVSDLHQVTERCLAFARALDGVVLTGYVSAELLEELQTVGIPHVVMGHPMSRPADDRWQIGQVVTTDNVAMGELATQTLVGYGHRRIGFVCERLPRGLWFDRWLRGYKLALLESGITADPAWVHVAGRAFAGGEPAAAAMAELGEPPTAFVVPDARTAGSFRAAMRARGVELGPRSLVVSGQLQFLTQFGVDDCPWIGFDVPLHTDVAVRQLRHLCVERMPCATEVIVPFATRGL